MTNLVKIEETQLEEVVKNSGLAIQEGEEIKKSYLPFLVSLAEIQAQSSKINFENPTEIDETIARELRLKAVKIRTGSAALKDERKKIYLLHGNLEQASYNLIKASCELTEEVFIKVEKAREIAEKARKEQLKLERSEKLSPYTESVALYPLSEMSEEQFEELYSGLRTAHENKLAAEKKTEEENKLREQRNEQIKPYWNFIPITHRNADFGKMTESEWNERFQWTVSEKEKQDKEDERIRQENERLKKEAEERERATQERIAQEEKERKEKQAEFERKLKEESDKAKKEAEEKERLAEIERKKQAQILADQKAKADKERDELLAKAEKERKEKERLESELKAKKEAEEKARKETEARIEAEKKAKAAAEKKAKLAPDKTKLLDFMQAINDLPRPEVKSIEAAAIATNANTLLVKVANYIKENADKL